MYDGFEVGDTVKQRLSGQVASITKICGALSVEVEYGGSMVVENWSKSQITVIGRAKIEAERKFKKGDRVIYATRGIQKCLQKCLHGHVGTIQLAREADCIVLFDVAPTSYGLDAKWYCQNENLELLPCGPGCRHKFQKGDKVKILRGGQGIMPGHQATVETCSDSGLWVYVRLDDSPDHVCTFPSEDVELTCGDESKMDTKPKVGTRVRYINNAAGFEGKTGTVCESPHRRDKEKIWVKFDCGTLRNSCNSSGQWVCRRSDLELLGIDENAVKAEIADAELALENAKLSLSQAQARLEFFKDAGKVPEEEELRTFMLVQEMDSTDSKWEKAKRLSQLITQGA